jgi:membrane protease YdiL (CAAX protease family)
VTDPIWLERPAYLRFLPRFLFDADHPKLLFVLKAWLLALLPSFALSGLISAATSVTAQQVEQPDIPTEGPLALFALIVIGPLLETLIMAAILLGLRRLVGPGPAVVLSALLWAVGHSLAASIWGLVVWWPFLIFSIAFLTWCGRSFWLGVGLVTLIHGLQNATVGVLLLFQPASG